MRKGPRQTNRTCSKPGRTVTAGIAKRAVDPLIEFDPNRIQRAERAIELLQRIRAVEDLGVGERRGGSRLAANHKPERLERLRIAVRHDCRVGGHRPGRSQNNRKHHIFEKGKRPPSHHTPKHCYNHRILRWVFFSRDLRRIPYFL